ncbi:TFIIB-type zinc ribbon-containing protein [Halospeciosus flavus]|uniref:TFIIB-type zinc ribbon-containing protein n=1 Tax=Halospeciosus flavus TaxID=3032283 RepID=UPI003621CD25
MSSRHIYENGFDEDCGRTLSGTCPECEGDLETDSGETACEECGLIIDEYRVDHAATPEISTTPSGVPNIRGGPSPPVDTTAG